MAGVCEGAVVLGGPAEEGEGGLLSAAHVEPTSSSKQDKQ